ncbi:MAG: FAD-dependent oxidoreductase [Rhodospirillales bacterium]
MTILPTPNHRPLKIAVVGTGIAGMSAAWLLDKNHDVTVFERNNRVGGHSNTVTVRTDDCPAVPVDTGFIVYNRINYPNLTALFDHLGVDTDASDMSFAASLGGGQVEYAGTDINGLFGQRRNILRPRFWLMLRDLLRFYRSAPSVLGDPDTHEMSLGDYLDSHGYSDAFVTDHLLPMGAAIWSTTAADMRAYPVRAFVRFFVSHGLLNLTDRPAWRTVRGGSRAYVGALTRSFSDRIILDGVSAIRREDAQVSVETASGATMLFDHVVIAAHADEAYDMLADRDPLETGLLGNWRYTRNRAVLHTDPALMPKNPRVWASWNFIEGDGDETSVDRPLCVTYWMNRLQPLPTRRNLFVTLNPVREPEPQYVVKTIDYSHPYFDQAALETQSRLWEMQGRRRTWFCGSYFGYGFHEDALQSGLAVAEQLGGMRRPWRVEAENGRIHVDPLAPHHVGLTPTGKAAA